MAIPRPESRIKGLSLGASRGHLNALITSEELVGTLVFKALNNIYFEHGRSLYALFVLRILRTKLEIL